MSKRHENILGTIGNTPVVKLNKIGPDHVNLYAKVESFNPMGSVKDRLALSVIERAEASGDLKPGQTVVEADQRQHRHRPRHGLRAERLSARHRDGGEFLHRAPQDDALPGCQGHSDAPRHSKAAACSRRQPNSLRNMAGSSSTSSKTKLMQTPIRARQRRKFWTRLPMWVSTTGCPVSAPAAR